MSTVTFHAVKRMGIFALVVLQDEVEVFVISKRLIDKLSNEELLQEVENLPWYLPIQDKEIIFRGEVVRNPERHAMKMNQF